MATRSPTQARRALDRTKARQPSRPAAAARRGRADLARKDARRLGRGSEALPIEVVATDGVRIQDASGRSHIDFLSGWCVGNLGWGQEAIRRRLRSYAGPDYVFPHLRYAPWVELADRLCRLAPGRMERCFRATGGSEAVDIALQAAMLKTGRRRFVSLKGAYHGNTLAGRLVGAADGRKSFGATILPCRQVVPPLDERALDRCEAMLRKRDVAAVILEPVPISLGCLVPEQAFMEGLREACDRTGTLLVLDEVATGFGRTGRMFAAEHFGVAPDLLVLAKAITSGYAPMGAVLMTADAADDVQEDLHAYSTYGWHPLAVEAALANLDLIDASRESLLDGVVRKGERLRRRLEAMELGEGRVQGLGLALALHLDEDASDLVERCRRQGLLLAADGSTVQAFPPLTIDEPTLDEGADILARALAEG